MKNWFFWAGVSFIIGGAISLALTLVVTTSLSPIEDASSYSIGWLIVGMVLIAIGFIKKKNLSKQ